MPQGHWAPRAILGHWAPRAIRQSTIMLHLFNLRLQATRRLLHAQDTGSYQATNQVRARLADSRSCPPRAAMEWRQSAALTRGDACVTVGAAVVSAGLPLTPAKASSVSDSRRAPASRAGRQRQRHRRRRHRRRRRRPPSARSPCLLSMTLSPPSRSDLVAPKCSFHWVSTSYPVMLAESHHPRQRASVQRALLSLSPAPCACHARVQGADQVANQGADDQGAQCAHPRA